jgi:Fe-S oxidoreductase
VPALYSGDKETAVALAEQNIAAMLKDDPDFVLTTCPTCTMALQWDFVDFLKDNPVWAAKAEHLAEITVDAAGFIVNQLGAAEVFKGLSAAEKVTYHDSCHLKRGAGVWKEPRELLTTSGRELIEMAHADRCCGFGGSYSLTSHPDISKQILGDKIKDIEKSGATCVAMDCPGCMLQLRGGLEKQEIDVRAMHTIQLLAESLE